MRYETDTIHDTSPVADTSQHHNKGMQNRDKSHTHSVDFARSDGKHTSR